VKIQIVHNRSDDPGCSVDVYVDGKRVPYGDVEVEDIDPGRGYDWEESWKPRLDDAMADRDAHPNDEFAVDVFQALLAGAESSHVKNKPDDWGLPYGYEPI
jgi:hypothetical protein